MTKPLSWCGMFRRARTIKKDSMKQYFAIPAMIVMAALLVMDRARADEPRPATMPGAEVQPDGSLLLKAETARILGFKMHWRTSQFPRLPIGSMRHESIEWPKAIQHKGKYEVEITYSCAPARAGNLPWLPAPAK